MTNDKPNRVDLSIGWRLQRLRMARGFGVDDVAGWLDVPGWSLVRAEAGERRLRARELYVLAARFQVPVGSFFHSAEEDDRNEGA